MPDRHSACRPGVSILARLTRIALGALALVIIGGATAFGVGTLRMRAADVAAPVAPPPLEVAALRFRLETGYRAQARFIGRVEARRVADMAFEAGGLIVEMLVEEGGAVRRGQPLARLDDALLGAERAVAAAQRAQVQARLSLARLIEDRQRQLVEGGAASRARHDDARFNVAALSAESAAIDARLAMIDIRRDKTLLRAPFDGVVTRRMADEGDVAGAGAPVLLLKENRRPQARIGVPPGLAARLAASFAAGEAPILLIDGREIAARLAARVPDIDPATRTETMIFDLTGGADPGASEILEGAVVELRAARWTPAAGGWLPVAALSEGRKGLWSVMVAIDGEIRREAVEVVALDGDRAFVRGTLRDGATVIAGGGNRLAPRQPVLVASIDGAPVSR